ncbi:hypothetical protein EKO27_g6854 [Xylaria grammica]|uniref:FAD-binding domain-containing protein n=1 Tax=Xylaria grammica TaxID=363999 RepID=A0A439D1B8_9PEZI|nr:hypothetical protein EKO27_g6854 [Xylaria grammica]
MAQLKQHYEAIIAGGGIADVTLVLTFEKVGITYVIVEGRDTLESDRGVGIDLHPNGMRILDQLGLAEDIERATVPLKTWFSYDAEGNLMSTPSAMGRYRNSGQDVIVFWFVFEDLRRSVPLSRVTRYNEADAEALCKTVAGVRVTPRLKFGDLFEGRIAAVKIAFEEGVALEWHTDCAVIVGDAACKATPVGSRGANHAIMEAWKTVVHDKKLSREAIKCALSSYAQTRAQPAEIGEVSDGLSGAFLLAWTGQCYG